MPQYRNALSCSASLAPCWCSRCPCSKRIRSPDLRRGQADGVEGAIQGDVQPPVAVEEEEQAERDEDHAARNLDQLVAIAHPTERRHRARERDACDEEGGAEAERVRGEECGAFQH